MRRVQRWFSSKASEFTSKAYAEAATTRGRIKKVLPPRETSSVAESVEEVKPLVSKVTGEPLYSMKPVRSSADLYRERRKNGVVDNPTPSPTAAAAIGSSSSVNSSSSVSGTTAFDDLSSSFDKDSSKSKHQEDGFDGERTTASSNSNVTAILGLVIFIMCYGAWKWAGTDGSRESGREYAGGVTRRAASSSAGMSASSILGQHDDSSSSTTATTTTTITTSVSDRTGGSSLHDQPVSSRGSEAIAPTTVIDISHSVATNTQLDGGEKSSSSSSSTAPLQPSVAAQPLWLQRKRAGN